MHFVGCIPGIVSKVVQHYLVSRKVADLPACATAGSASPCLFYQIFNGQQQSGLAYLIAVRPLPQMPDGRHGENEFFAWGGRKHTVQTGFHFLQGQAFVAEFITGPLKAVRNNPAFGQMLPHERGSQRYNHSFRLLKIPCGNLKRAVGVIQKIIFLHSGKRCVMVERAYLSGPGPHSDTVHGSKGNGIGEPFNACGNACGIKKSTEWIYAYVVSGILQMRSYAVGKTAAQNYSFGIFVHNHDKNTYLYGISVIFMKRKTKTIFRASAQVLLAGAITFLLILVFQKPFDTVHHDLRILVTGDVHGNLFDSTYTGTGLKTSLQNVAYYVDSIRNAEGEENVLLLDIGDCLQGDNSVYYYNFVDTLSPHIVPRMMSYMRYDAWIVGNHDIEAGHSVFDRVTRELDDCSIVTLAGNTPLQKGNGSYFNEYCIFKKAGLKVLLLGYTNANISNWVPDEASSGMDFESVVKAAGRSVNALRKRYRPDVVVLAMHSGTGAGDGTSLENEALDVMNSIQGIDVVVGAHDHSPYIQNNGKVCFLNSGSKAANLGSCLVSVRKRLNRKVSVELDAANIRVSKDKVNPEMLDFFHDDYLKVKDFTLRPVGQLQCLLASRDAYAGMNNYENLVNTVQLQTTGADISFCAPLSFNGKVCPGQVVFNDMFTIYPYENSLFKINLTGRQVKDYLEYSYDMWVGGGNGTVLNIAEKADKRTGSQRWSFVDRHYNFDSAAGLVYEVYPLNEKGKRVIIRSMADGSAFDESAVYTVALNSYRASGGGKHLVEGAGISPDSLDSLVQGRFGEIRNLIYDYFCTHTTITADDINDPSLLGSWSFEPAAVRQKIAAELDQVFND